MSETEVLKTISQETFDIVVSENIDDFELEPDEALKDAVEQFKSQGVNINIIIKEVREKNGKHKVLNLVNKLAKLLEEEGQFEKETTQSILHELNKELGQDLSKRYQACKLSDAGGVLFKACVHSSKKDIYRLESFRAFASLVNGQPDEVKRDCLKFFTETLKENELPEIAQVTTQIIKFACTMQENNRQAIISMGVISLLLSTLEQFVDHPSIVQECCGALRALTLDDDVRVQFGKAHDHAKMIVTEHAGLERLSSVLKEHNSDAGLVKTICSTLTRIMVRNEFCQQFVDLGGFSAVKDSVDAHLTNSGVVKCGVNLILAISGNDDVKIYLVKNGCVEMLMSILNQWISNSSICEATLAALTSLCLRNPAHCKFIADKKAAPLIIKGMEVHATHAGVQKQACRVIRNLVARTREHSPLFLELGAEELIRTARKQHAKDLDDEAKAALRDLDLEVDLKQLWTGSNQGVKC